MPRCSAVGHLRLDLVPGPLHQHRRLLGVRLAAGHRLELAQGRVDGGPLARTGDPPQCPQRQHQGQRLVRGQPQRPRQVVGVRQVDDPLAVDGVHVDVDQVAGGQPRHPAHPQHVQVGPQRDRADPEGGRHLGQRGAVVLAQVRHQGQQAAHLGPGGHHADTRSSSDPARHPVHALGDRSQHLQHPLAQLGRIEHDGVGAVADDLLGHRAEVGEADRQGLEARPAAAPCRPHASSRSVSAAAERRTLARRGRRPVPSGSAPGSQRAGQRAQVEVLGHLVGARPWTPAAACR